MVSLASRDCRAGTNRYLPHDSIAGDTKAGTLIATDRFGNKYYENLEEELPRKLQCGFDITEKMEVLTIFV